MAAETNSQTARNFPLTIESTETCPVPRKPRVVISILHPLLLIGLVLAAIPVALHLLLRARPKKLMFPALRLLQQRRMQNQRRMRLRHIWLLLLRMGVIAVLVIALARPTLPPANYTPTFGEIFGLATIISLALAAYFACMTYWQRQRLAAVTLSNRRTYLRGGLGCAALLLAALLVAWPYQRRVAAEITSPAPAAFENVPVAAVFLIDTSLSMNYQFEGQTRLDAARTMALEQLERLPSGSQATVLDLAGEFPTVLSPDLAAVQNRLTSLSAQPVVQAVNDRLRTAIRFQRDERRRLLGGQANVTEDLRQDKFVREIYLFTDLAQSAWRADDTNTLAAEIAAEPWLGVYLIDVGIEQPVDVGVVDPRLSRAAVGAGGQVLLEATVRTAATTPSDVVVELWHASDGGSLAKRDQQTVATSREQAGQVRFLIDQLAGSVVQGELRLVTTDPLPMDDAAYFTVKVLPPLKVLVVSETRAMTGFWAEALNALNTVGGSYQVTIKTTAQLLDLDLQDFDLVCAINLACPPAEVWRKLKTFTNDGGGLLVCVGANSALSGGSIDPVAYATPEALELLPGRIKASLQFRPAQHLNLRDPKSPWATSLENLGALASLTDVDFRRYWSVEVLPEGVTLARWTDEAQQPAFLTREIGRGRCALFTSSVDSTAWSDWPGDWTIVVVADHWLQYLSRAGSSQQNFQVGDAVTLMIDRSIQEDQGLLRLPDLTQRSIARNAETSEVTALDLVKPGNYQVVSSNPSANTWTGFSLNLPSAESDLIRLDEAALDGYLGQGKYHQARDPESLSRSVSAGRLGQEMAGLFLSLLVVVFVVEQATATWFYKQDDAVA
ncbi:hypothetical protein GC163_09480 [bacterium]|nr:hypothetical protein [bacterium]